METWLMILLSLSPLFLIVIFLLFWLIYDLVRFTLLSDRAEESYAKFCSDVGYVSYLCGNVGAGKTTIGCGFTNFLTLKLIQDSNKTIDDFHRIFYYVDFNILDSLIFHCFHYGNYKSSFVMKYCFRESPYFEIIFDDSKYYDDYLSIKSYKSLFKDYIDALSAIIRNNYVYFNQDKFFNRITSSYAYRSDSSLIEIKDRYKNKDYKLFNYSIVFDDEKVLDKKNTDYQKIAKEDRGADMFLRLIRHIGEGHLYYLTTSQRFTRVVLEERELATSIFYVNSRKEVLSYSLFIFLCDLFINFLNFCTKFLYSFLHDDIASLKANKPSRIRRLCESIKHKKDYLYAHSYILYRGVLYHSIDDVGKKPENCAFGSSEFSYLIPITFCYGSADTYGFHFIEEELEKCKSVNIKDSASKISLSEYANQLLSQKESEKASKPSKVIKNKVSNLDVEGVF